MRENGVMYFKEFTIETHSRFKKVEKKNSSNKQKETIICDDKIT